MQIPAYQILMTREKGKRFSFEEKKEIFNKINEGVPIRDIRELWQISNQQFKIIIKGKDAKI